ncbi:hypothetical protein AUP45_21960 [Thalassospira xiamenensis]|nr:hypothetical protein AUP45_21960 [Thalassospira xiamenensis]
MYFSLLDQGARPRSQIDLRFVEIFQPGVSVTISKNEKQPFDLDALTSAQELHKMFWSQIGKSLEDHVKIVKTGMRWQFIECFKDRPFR